MSFKSCLVGCVLSVVSVLSGNASATTGVDSCGYTSDGILTPSGTDYLYRYEIRYCINGGESHKYVYLSSITPATQFFPAYYEYMNAYCSRANHNCVTPSSEPAWLYFESSIDDFFCLGVPYIWISASPKIVPCTPAQAEEYGQPTFPFITEIDFSCPSWSEDWYRCPGPLELDCELPSEEE